MKKIIGTLIAFYQYTDKKYEKYIGELSDTFNMTNKLDGLFKNVATNMKIPIPKKINYNANSQVSNKNNKNNKMMNNTSEYGKLQKVAA